MAIGGFLDLVFPRRCLACRVPGSDFCDACRTRLPRIAPPLCERCGAPTAWPVRRCLECAGRRLAFATARAAVAYDTGARALVSGWKESGLRNVAALAADIVAEAIPPPAVDGMTCVPADPDRALARGHHPAAALARELAHRWNLDVIRALDRVRSTPRQAGLELSARRRNVAGAFAPAGRGARRIVLVDDVYTTGATVSAAASALRRGGARRVDVVTFARALR